MTRLTATSTRRFLLAGTGAAALHATLTYALIRSGLDASIAAASAYVVAIGVAYLAQKNWAFQSRSAHRRDLHAHRQCQRLSAQLTLGVRARALNPA